MDSLIVVLVVVGVVMVLAGVARMRSRRKHSWDDIDHSVLFSKGDEQDANDDAMPGDEFVGKARPVAGSRRERATAEATDIENDEPRIHLDDLPDVDAPLVNKPVASATSFEAFSEGRERKIDESVVHAAGVEIKVQKRERPQPAMAAQALAPESDVETLERPQPEQKKSGLLDKLGINVSREEVVAEPTLDIQARGYKEGAPPWVLVLNIAAPEGTHFNGGPLMKAVNDAGLELGEMDMFHYMVDGDIQFSLANMIKPGTFNIDEIDKMKTPGVSLFIQVSELKTDVAEVYQNMLDITRALARKLGGDVRDASRSALTQSAIRSNQEKIAEYNMKWLIRN